MLQLAQDGNLTQGSLGVGRVPSEHVGHLLDSHWHRPLFAGVHGLADCAVCPRAEELAYLEIGEEPAIALLLRRRILRRLILEDFISVVMRGLTLLRGFSFTLRVENWVKLARFIVSPGCLGTVSWVFKLVPQSLPASSPATSRRYGCTFAWSSASCDWEVVA